jgi:hypothetical protein
MPMRHFRTPTMMSAEKFDSEMKKHGFQKHIDAIEKFNEKLEKSPDSSNIKGIFPYQRRTRSMSPPKVVLTSRDKKRCPIVASDNFGFADFD